MKRLIKWALVVLAALTLFVIAILVIVPFFVDLEKYRPVLEKSVSEAAGRPCKIEGELKLSLFPRAAISLTRLRLDAPPGFEDPEFVSIQSFQASIRLRPLLSKEVEVERFIVRGPKIKLVKSRDGRGNWEGLGAPKPKERPAGKKEGSPDIPDSLPIRALNVESLVISGGQVSLLDLASGAGHTVTDLGVTVDRFSLSRSNPVALSAKIDGLSLNLKGSFGPFAPEPLKGPLPFELDLVALGHLKMKIKGRLSELLPAPAFDLSFDLAPFSPRKLLTALGRSKPIPVRDPKALEHLAFRSRVHGTPDRIMLDQGGLELDESKLTFSGQLKPVPRPDLTFQLNLDRIDATRYLPPQGKSKPGEDRPGPSEGKKTDYAPLRQLVLNGDVHVGQLKIMDLVIEDAAVKITGRDGLIRIDPFKAALHGGQAAGRVLLDVTGDDPESRIELKASGIDVRPFVRMAMKKDVLEGTVQTELSVHARGDDPNRIKNSLNGQGGLLLNDGAIIGLDLAGMVRNAAASVGLAKKTGAKLRTDFSEFKLPFTIENGLVRTSNTTMASPLLRVKAAGWVSLPKEQINIRIEPTLVATLAGQGDRSDRTGIMVPLLVTGPFSSPKIQTVLAKDIEEKIDQAVSGAGNLKKEVQRNVAPDRLKKGAGDFLKKLPFGK
ncbi:MAG: AsmA family protein [Proteobacteria bacterium]|nr:AsmA family protein [Pseudomonadota bacterium]